ncbi:MAG: RNA-guided endonuclease IscB [Ktedonobacteraceae bacterium]
MSHVFVVDTNKKPLHPVHPGRARILLSSGKAAVSKRYPFTIILKAAVVAPMVQPLRVKLDPGAKTTGIAVVDDSSGKVVFAAELEHRASSIKASLDERRAHRRSRRQRHTRYRKPRFANRPRRRGGMPPSLLSRVCNVETWVKRLQRVCPIQAISMELVRFDLQKLEHPEIAGVEYQQGTLAGYEVREYLLNKWNRMCAYCSKKDVPLQVEHIQPRAKGGTNRISNLTLACEACNLKKGTQDIAVFLKNQPDVLKRLLAQAKVPLKDAAAVNSMRWALYERLKTLSLPVECGSGGLTKFNRVTRHLEKAHWRDAVCVGKSTPETVQVEGILPLLITATGYGTRQMCGTNKQGFPIRHRQRKKVHHTFQTGDLVRAVVPQGTHAGVHVGRVLTRASGSFDIRTAHGRKGGIHARYCQPLHRNDGYSYQSARGGHSSPA